MIIKTMHHETVALLGFVVVIFCFHLVSSLLVGVLGLLAACPEVPLGGNGGKFCILFRLLLLLELLLRGEFLV